MVLYNKIIKHIKIDIIMIQTRLIRYIYNDIKLFKLMFSDINIFKLI